MRGPLPLSDSDFAAVRAAVLARIAQRRRAPWGELAALAGSVVVAILSVVMARQPIVVGTPLAHFTPVARQVARSELRVASPTHTQPATRNPHHHVPRKPSIQLARIEIHTADPDIRIIWITNQEAP